MYKKVFVSIACNSIQIISTNKGLNIKFHSKQSLTRFRYLWIFLVKHIALFGYLYNMILVRKPKEINLKHLPGYNQCFRGIRYDPQCPMCLCFLYQNMSKIRFDLTQRKKKRSLQNTIDKHHSLLCSFFSTPFEKLTDVFFVLFTGCCEYNLDCFR